MPGSGTGGKDTPETNDDFDTFVTESSLELISRYHFQKNE